MRDDLKFYDVQPVGPKKTVLIAFYERFRETQGPLRNEVEHMDVIQFAEYLLEHLTEFQVELAEYEALEKQPCPACGKPRIEHSYTERIACVIPSESNHSE